METQQDCFHVMSSCFPLSASLNFSKLKPDQILDDYPELLRDPVLPSSPGSGEDSGYRDPVLTSFPDSGEDSSYRDPVLPSSPGSAFGSRYRQGAKAWLLREWNPF